MIYIIDNGKSYSDHALHFVDLLDMPADLFEELLRVFAELESPYPSAPSVVAIAERLDWRMQTTLLPVAAYFDTNRFWAVLMDEDAVYAVAPTRRQAFALAAAVPFLEPGWRAAIAVSGNSIALRGIADFKLRLAKLTAESVSIPALED